MNRAVLSGVLKSKNGIIYMHKTDEDSSKDIICSFLNTDYTNSFYNKYINKHVLIMGYIHSIERAGTTYDDSLCVDNIWITDSSQKYINFVLLSGEVTDTPDDSNFVNINTGDNTNVKVYGKDISFNNPSYIALVGRVFESRNEDMDDYVGDVNDEVDGDLSKIDDYVIRDSPINTFPSKLYTSKVHNLFEFNILHTFERLEHKYHYYYNSNDIINFFTSMRNSSMTILSGISGIGKTQLVKLYAMSLGIDLHSYHYNHISVSPTWTSDSNLLGFLYPNKTKNGDEYLPSESGLVDTLIRASNNKNSLYVILFDEMNLSRVEDYFSQFLSVMDNNSDSRYITLYNKSRNCVNNYPYRIPINNNVLFVGTINTDESTYNITDKVRDRSNIIRLSTIYLSTKTKSRFKKIFHSWYNDMNDKLDDNKLDLLFNLGVDISRANNNLGVGWRIIKKINEYLNELPDITNLPNDISKDVDPNMYLESAFDYELSQRILNKISGSKHQWYPFLHTSNNNMLKGKLLNDLTKYFEDSPINIHDSKSYNILVNKAKELEDYGFAD